MAIQESEKRAIWFTQTLDIGSIAAATTLDVDITELNVPAGAAVVPVPPATLEANVIVAGAWADADGSVKLRVGNPTAGAIDPASADWSFAVIY